MKTLDELIEHAEHELKLLKIQWQHRTIATSRRINQRIACQQQIIDHLKKSRIPVLTEKENND